jgi:hypothetical protein
MSDMEAYIQDLQLLNDVMRESPLAEKYAVWAGLHLGIVRNGRPLDGDLDADFFYMDSDIELFVQAIPFLLEAGFNKCFRFMANDGIIWEHTFVKGNAKFEFFRFTKADDGRLGYYDFAFGPPMQQWKAYIDGPLAPMDFLGRTWLVSEDADAALTTVYGNWRVEDRSWYYANDPLTLRREPWLYADSIGWK